jgi:hemerythrin-like domain-containing protein
MIATDILMSEHRVIEGVIHSIETAAQRLESGQTVRPEFFLSAADFIKGFADGCHHKKEEGVLFKALGSFGLPADGGPVAVMLAEHEEGRVFTAGMRQAALRLQAGEPSAALDVAKNARGYAALLRQHIQKEDTVLFPIADQVLPPQAQNDVLEGFEHVEHEETGEGVHEKYLAIAQSLEREMSGG